MIAYVKGELAEKTPSYVVVDCHGMGYLLQISLHTYAQLPHTGTVLLHTELIVREDAQILFGFAGTEERTLFRHLISVSGVGPNTARMILSSMSPDEISQAIVNNNVGVLQSIKGIGAKSAQRIVLDLKDKLQKEGIQTVEILGGTDNTTRQEALSALVMLGYNKATAQKTIAQILKKSGAQTMSVEQLIKEALKYA